MNKTIDRFFMAFRKRLELSAADSQVTSSGPNNADCGQDRYYSVDREGEVRCPIKQHSSHEVVLAEAEQKSVGEGIHNSSNTSLKPGINYSRVWQVSYELIQFIYSKNVSGDDHAQDKSD